MAAVDAAAPRIAVVTGGGSGIGAALCEVLARRGARVVCADLDGDGAAAMAARLRARGREATGVRVDVTSADDVAALAAATLAREGRVDLWINNAGIAVGGAADELELADWRRVLDVNLAGVIHGIHAIYPHMIRRGAGHIVNIASVAGLSPFPLALPYTTSKHAVVGLSQALRAEARGRGVRVSVACPGVIDTPIWQRSEVRGGLEKVRELLLARRPAPMPAERCAEAILRGVDANLAIIPVTVEARVAWWLHRLSPALSGWIASRLAAKAFAMTR